MRVIENLIPPGGWHFEGSNKGVRYRVEGYSYRDLVDKVLKYRIENTIPIGAHEHEVRTYICTLSPRNCQDGLPDKIVVKQQLPPATAKLDEVTRWATELQGKQGANSRVPEQEANGRGAICVVCEFNKIIPTGCAACGSNFNRLMTILRNGKDSAHWAKLHVCELTKQGLRSAVWIKKEFLRTASNLPGACWLK